MCLFGRDEVPLQPGLRVGIRRLVKDQRNLRFPTVVDHLLEIIRAEGDVMYVFALFG